MVKQETHVDLDCLLSVEGTAGCMQSGALRGGGGGVTSGVYAFLLSVSQHALLQRCGGMEAERGKNSGCVAIA